MEGSGALFSYGAGAGDGSTDGAGGEEAASEREKTAAGYGWDGMDDHRLTD